MIDLESWLESLGLGQYAQVLADNDVDFRSLPALTEQDLKELGLSLGHRRLLQRAAQELSSVSLQVTEEQVNVDVHRLGEAERRQLTVMFCDMVDSVGIGQQLDLEDYRDLLRRFREAVTKAVEQYQGFVARHQGDGLLVYFGYPAARENAAQQAVLAALQAVEAVQDVVYSGAAAEIRIGIATGMTLIGDILPTGSSSEIAALGPTPNLAARLQGAAAPNSIVISETTQRVVAGAFDVAPVALELKGIPGTTRAYRLLSHTGARSRIEAAERSGLSRLVGRQEELALIEKRWLQSASGTGQLVLICAEPGVGKSRLVYELQARLEPEPNASLTLYCAPDMGASPLYPVIEAFKETIHLSASTTDEDKLGAIAAWTRRLDLDAEAATILGRLLFYGETYPTTPTIDEGHAHREAFLELALAMMAKLASKGPLELVAEDLHWADPTTLEFLTRLVELIPDCPVLALFTFRPEFSPPWSNASVATSLRLSNLTAAESRALVGSVAPGAGDALRARIVSRSEGVPLFAEELAFSVAAQSDAEIPETLQDALTARLDRLGDARPVAQAASVLGRNFDVDVLASITGLSETKLEAALAKLLSSGIVSERPRSSSRSMYFRHALVRDAAYESLLRGTRQSLHLEAAKSLSSAKAQFALLAHHYEQGGDIDSAVMHLVDAARLALSRAAYAEALALSQRGIELLDKTSIGFDRDATELALQVYRGNSRRTISSHFDEVVLDAYDRVIDLAQTRQLGDEEMPMLLPVYCGMAIAYAGRGEVSAAVRRAEQALSLAQELEAPAWQCYLQSALAFVYLSHDRYLEGIDHAQKGFDLYEPGFDDAHQFTGANVNTRRHSFLAAIQAMRGNLDTGRLLGLKGLGIAKRSEHGYSICNASTWLVTALFAGCEYTRAREYLALMQEVAKAEGFGLYEAVGAEWTSICQIAEGDTAGGMASIRSAERSPALSGFKGSHARVTAFQVDALLRAREPECALEVLERALDWQGGEDILYRHAGMMLSDGAIRLALNDSPVAKLRLEKAMRLAHDCGAKVWELRAATWLAQALAAEERHSEARERLAQVLEPFTEGFDTPLLQDAKAVLNAYGGP